MADIIVRQTSLPAAFLNGAGWTLRRHHARRFRSIQEAVKYCADRDVEDAEIVIDFRERNVARVIVSLPQLASGGHGPTEEWVQNPTQFPLSHPR